MECAGFDPAKDQSRLAKLIGKPCKPQNIQHLLDASNEVANSKYLLDLAEQLRCDPFWLGKGKGTRPEKLTEGTRSTWIYHPQARNAPELAHEPALTRYLWPFKKFTFEDYNEQDESIKESIETIICGLVKNRASLRNRVSPRPISQTFDQLDLFSGAVFCFVTYKSNRAIVVRSHGSNKT